MLVMNLFKSCYVVNVGIIPNEFEIIQCSSFIDTVLSSRLHHAEFCSEGLRKHLGQTGNT